MSDPAAAWQAWCAQLARTGESITTAGWPDDDRDQAEGFRHLARLTVMALQSYVEFGNADFPAFHRYDDDAVKWGGPNVDNHYLRARIDAAGIYRIRGNVRGVRDLIVSTHEGDMQLGQYGVFSEQRLAELVVIENGDITITLGGEPTDGNWIALDPAASLVMLRVYVADWSVDEPGWFDIERLDRSADRPAALDGQTVARALGDAAHWVDTSVHYWRDYLESSPVRALVNTLSPPRGAKGGSGRIRYGAGWWKLNADEALAIDFERPDCDYWSFQLYSTPWFESLDVRNRVNSYTNATARVAGDHVRLVVSGVDPGVANWLDTEGRHEGMISYRFIGSEAPPTPLATKLSSRALDDLRRQGTFTELDRRAQIDDRRLGIARRFRR
jgi:hypothetical protein